MRNILAPDLSAACVDKLSLVDSELLDCVSDDLALALAVHGVDDVRAPFGVDWRFDLVDTGAEPPRLALPPTDQDVLLGERTGWQPRWHATTAPDADLSAWATELRYGRPVVLVGDAYHLPWLPYRGHEHMDHGFVLAGVRDDVALVVDPYDNATEWGRATPLSTELPAGELDAALADGRWAVLEPAERRGAEQADDAAAIVSAAENGAYQQFLDGHAQAGVVELHNLSLQCWLLARSRGLHARWLTEHGQSTTDAVSRFAAEIVPAWRRASELAYVALRRVRSGRRAPTAALDAVRTAADNEVRLAREMLRRRDRTDGRNWASC
ncbi:MAG TPA: BtrH N-terminal domain-containing protein [Pseudonocardiaceae bacterium]|jgi:hypothetical protein